MGMDLSHGKYLTHGSPVNFSGKYFNVVSYGVNKETELLDYDELEKKQMNTNLNSLLAELLFILELLILNASEILQNL